MSEPLEVWADTGRDGRPAGVLHWVRFGEGAICGKDAGYPTDFDDLNAALRAGRVAGYDVYPCGTCRALRLHA
jgi:hypothetical protein